MNAMQDCGWMPMMGFGFGMVLFSGVLIVGALLLGKWLLEQRHGPSESALDILRKRYAGGEIDKQEFETRRRDLVA